jgi:hypothetical protein
MTRCRRDDEMGPKEPLMNRLVRLVLVLLVVAWFVPAVRPLVALGARADRAGAEVDDEQSMRSPL